MLRNHARILALAAALAAPLPALAGAAVDTRWTANIQESLKKADCTYVVPYLTAETLTLVIDCTAGKKGAKARLAAQMYTLPSGTLYDTCDTGTVKLKKGQTTTLSCALDRPQLTGAAGSRGTGSVSVGS